MKQINYEDIKIEMLQKLYKTNYITEIILDADSKTAKIKEDEYLMFELEENINMIINMIVKSVQPIVNAICEIVKEIFNDCKSIFQKLDIIQNKKITKKKFMKLLQCKGIQRNTINEIVKNNKEPYTYLRFYQILQNAKEGKMKGVQLCMKNAK